ncbi:MAG: YraN family protein [Pseudomonas sp.]|nr:YraN family protein [Pseudomonas sp.]HBS80703.1 YraN family protein [Pseudomonas sp.]
MGRIPRRRSSSAPGYVRLITNSKQISGKLAEDLTLRHLETCGLRLICRNWSCRSGELDLVMLDGDTVVFVEVRYRRHAAWGGALESVDLRKQQKLIKAAQLFLLKESRWAKHPCRFDVVAMGSTEGGAHPSWIRNAFDS